MSKTITIYDVKRDPTAAKHRAEDLARAQARFRVIEAKRRMCGKALAWVDGAPQDGGADARSDLRVPA